MGLLGSGGSGPQSREQGDFARVLEVTRSEKQIEVHVATERRPLIYLDQCALYDVCKHDAVGARFKEFFKTRGELLLSSINMFELGQLQGDSLVRAKEFLDETIGLASDSSEDQVLEHAMATRSG